MAQEVAPNKKLEKTTHRILPSLIIMTPPIILIALFYIYRDHQQFMDWVNSHISAPYRSGAAFVTSFGPLKYFSLAELLMTIIGLWALFFIIRTIIVLIRDDHRIHWLTRRLIAFITVGLYIFTWYTWSWAIVYRTTNLAEKTGMTYGVTVSQLEDITALFAARANALSGEVQRDNNGHFIESSDYYFAQSKGVYSNIVKEFPSLDGNVHPPKAMVYSKLMSLTGFTGVYIALTGETNINTDAPGCLIPATIAHEMAHQRGISAEEEANFVGIAACVTSNIPVYEYSGYLQGLIYLSDALNKAAPESWSRIASTLNKNVVRDWTDNSDYWQQYESGASEAVSAMYDSYLKGNGQNMGIASYGACVDMLVTWMTTRSA